MNGRSVFLVAMALLCGLECWRGWRLVLLTLHPPSDVPLNLEPVMVPGSEVAFKRLFQAMFEPGQQDDPGGAHAGVQIPQMCRELALSDAGENPLTDLGAVGAS